MNWINIAFGFLFVSNLAFMTVALVVLMRIQNASTQTRAEMLKAASLSMEAGKQLQNAAKRAVHEIDRIGENNVVRESSNGRAVQQLAFQVKNLIDQVNRNAAQARSSEPGTYALSEQEADDLRAKLQAELNAALAKNHQLQEQIEQTQLRLHDVANSSDDMREELSSTSEIKQSVLDNMMMHVTELEARLKKARERAKAAEKHAEDNAFQLDELRAQINAQKFSRPVQDQSDLVRDQRDQIEVLAARERALLAKIEQMEMEFKRHADEKGFIEERFLQLDSVTPPPNPI
jgi:hypothetical protein